MLNRAKYLPLYVQLFQFRMHLGSAIDKQRLDLWHYSFPDNPQKKLIAHLITLP